MSVVRLASLLLAAALLAAPAPAGAKEESKIQIALDPVGGGAAGARNGAKLRTQFMPGQAGLQMQVKGLAPSAEYLLLADGLEILRFTSGSNGQANVKVDLLRLGAGDLAAAPVDPRGTLVTINDGAADVFAGWLYGPVANDPSRVLVNESTFLAPDPVAAPSGTAIAGYMMTPNRKAKLRISLVGAPVGEYEIWVDDVLVGTLTTNPAGNASADFRSDVPRTNGNAGGNGNGNGKPKKAGNAKLPLDFDPRMAWIELRLAGAPVFAGEMAAQIGGLNVCLPTVTPVALAPTPAAPAAVGSLAFVGEDDCSRQLSVAAAGLVPGTADLVVAGVAVATLVVAADGTAAAVFDTSPDAVGELPLDFALPSGAPIAIGQGGVEALSAQIP